MNNRALRRAMAKKGGGNLAVALNGLKELTGSLKDVLPEARRDLEQAQDFLKHHHAGMAELRGEIAQLRYELERQRAVSHRMLADVGLLPANGPWIADLEVQYAAEYDAMRFLCWVAMLGAGEDP